MLQKDYMIEGQDCIRNYSKECMPFLDGFHFFKIVPSSNSFCYTTGDIFFFF